MESLYCSGRRGNHSFAEIKQFHLALQYYNVESYFESKSVSTYAGV